MKSQVSAGTESMLNDVIQGMRQPQKKLPSKYFYDERGSELLEQITRLEEYYLTRTEKRILETNINEITDCIGPRAMLVELGSGSSKKIRLLLKELSSLVAYVPVDISEEYLLKAVHNLRMDYPKVSIIPVFADYTSHFDLPDLGEDYEKQVLFFPGSTIGNFSPSKSRLFLDTLASLTDENAGMLVGVDLKKDKDVLEAAYNDKEGITAKFNKNILVRLNRELGTDFRPDCFTHHAWYNEKEGRIEMHLIAQKEQRVKVGDEEFQIEKGESIHTENSYKYSLGGFEEMVSDWFTVNKVWTDEQNYFSLQFLTKKIR
jgi:dimethylhistidine N-methyltransferase